MVICNYLFIYLFIFFLIYNMYIYIYDICINYYYFILHSYLHLLIHSWWRNSSHFKDTRLTTHYFWSNFPTYPPQEINIEPKMEVWKMSFLFKGEIFRFQLLAYDWSTGHHIYCEDSCERSTGCLAKERDPRDEVQQACHSCLRAGNGEHHATRIPATGAGGHMDGVRSPWP